jgi:hypothetical protein
MDKFAVIFATHIPSEDKLWIGEDILIKIKKYLPDADIFVGVNPSPCIDKWVKIIKKYTEYYEITPHNLTINSDASSYQSALRIYKNHIKDYDLIWFLHTQGTKSGRHNVRESHLNTLLYENKISINEFNNKEVGAYGHSLTPLPNCWIDSEWDFYLERFGVKFINRPIRCFFVGTMFIIRGNILNNFILKCSDIFFNEILHNTHTNGQGDPWFFERDFIHIVDGFNDLTLKPKFVINNYGLNLNGLSDLEHYNKLLNEWKIKNNFNKKYIIT